MGHEIERKAVGFNFKGYYRSSWTSYPNHYKFFSI
jgi:hypothetical protein